MHSQPERFSKRTGDMAGALAPSFYNLVSAHENCFRQGEPQESCRAAAYNQREERRLLDGKLRRLGSLDDTMDMRRRLPIHRMQVGAIAHQGTRFKEATVGKDCWNAVPHGE